MKRNLAIVLALGAFAGCGDNSDECGPGTTAVNGVCTPSSAPPTCTDGTILNASTNSCEIDPNSCQGGTVLINDKCQDPTAGLTIDLEEGAEPNGLNIGEASTVSAGAVTLKPIGSTFVIHGHITPFQDADGDGISDPDFDTYELAVTAPTLLEVTADGVNGILGAFIVSGDANGLLPNYRRFGMNLTGDTSKRKIYLPTAGTYDITIGDTRSMFLDATSPPAAGAGGAAGGPMAEYYVSISALDIPAPTALTVTAGVATDTGTGATGLGLDDLKFYTVPMGTGFNDIQLDMPQVSASASVIVVNNGTFKVVADESVDPNFGTDVPADAALAGVNPTDTTLIVGDYNWNYGPEAADYTLTVTQGNAVQLKTDGTSTTPVNEISDLPATLQEFNTFFFDVATDGEIDGMKISWSRAIDGVLVDSNVNIISNFTFDPVNGFVGNTWTDYNGLLRLLTAGRYYFVVYDPTFDSTVTPPTTIAAASTITVLTPTVIAFATPTATITNNVFNSTPFTYDAGTTVPWQQYLSNSAGTGVVTLSFLDPSTAAGRLDKLTITDNVDGTGVVTAADEVTPLFTQALTNNIAKGRILLDDTVTSYIVKANTANAATTGTYKLTFDQRKSPVAGTPFGAFGTVTATPTVLSPNTLAAADKMFFLAKATAGQLVKTIATPTGVVKPDVELISLNADETPDVTLQTVGTGAETGIFPAHTGGWVAVQVNAGAAVATTGTFDISAELGVAKTYSNPNATVAFVSICVAAGTNDVTMHADNSGLNDPTDEGLSDPLPVPAGFQFFGASVGALQVSSNGWLSFQTNQVDSFGFDFNTFGPANVTMPTPDVPNALIAPYWTDLGSMTVCAKTVGPLMTVEWSGNDFASGAIISMQVQLNATTQTITFVYGATQAADGGDATVGIEDFAGVNADLLSFDTTNTVAPSTTQRFTPN